MAILVTGGLGFIGSHTVVALIKNDYHVVILDNLCNSKLSVLERIERITNVRPDFVAGDVRDVAALDSLFKQYSIDAVLHFAGLKAVGESVSKPLDYYENNVHGSLQLISSMRNAGVNRFIFSSSATVYGSAASVPYAENALRNAANPYGRTKLIVEDILKDIKISDPDYHFACLRYFNPAGAHESGLIGEDPEGIPNNLMPFIAQVASGRRPSLKIFGGDYPTPDGTCIRDFIHVMDLAEGHVASLRYLEKNNESITVNLGRGSGVSVLEMVYAFQKVSGRHIPFEIVGRRPGDLDQYWANPEKAALLLGWKASRGIHSICSDAWKWQLFSEEDKSCGT